MTQRPRTSAAVVWCVLLGAAVAWMASRYNDFPPFFHTDEPTKIEQLVTRDFNFFHPQLLLAASDILRWTLDLQTPEAIVQAGRWVSAICAGLSVVGLSLLGMRLRGWAGMLSVGVAAGMCASLAYFSHFMKEDSALVMGLAWWMLGASWFWERRTTSALVGLGIACGVAASSKYIGTLTGAGSIVLIALALWPRQAGGLEPPGATEDFSGPTSGLKPPGLAILIFIGVSGATYALLNLQALLHVIQFLKGLAWEMQHASVAGHVGFHIGVPHLLNLPQLVLLPPVVLVLAAVYLVCVAVTWRRRRFGDWLLIGFCVAWFTMLCFSPLVNPRYFLPVAVGVHALAGLGLVELLVLAARLPAIRGRSRQLTPVLLTAGLMVLGIGLWPSFYHRSVEVFRDDARLQLRAWIVEHLPADAYIVQEWHGGLIRNDGTRYDKFEIKLPQRINVLPGFPSGISMPAFENLVAKGVTHVVLVTDRYEYFEDGYSHLDPELREEFLRRRRFYRELFAHAELIWSRPYVHSANRVVRTPESASLSRQGGRLEVWALGSDAPRGHSGSSSRDGVPGS